MIFKIDEIYDEGLDFEVFESKQHFDINSPDCSLTEDVKCRGSWHKLVLGYYAKVGWKRVFLQAVPDAWVILALQWKADSEFISYLEWKQIKREVKLNCQN